MSSIADQLRQMFADGQARPVNDLSLLLEAADELDYLREQLDAANEDYEQMQAAVMSVD